MELHAFGRHNKQGIWEPDFSFQESINNQQNEWDKEEVAFVPPCTQYVFFKTYNHTPTTMVNWAEDDAKAYLDDIKEKLKYYLSEDRNINGGQK